MQDFELSERQKLAAQLMALGTHKKLVAQEIGITRRTLYNWERLPEFQAELTLLLKDSESSVRLKLRAMLSEAVTTLQTLMTDTRTPAAVRATIAYRLLELVLQDRVLPLPPGTRSPSFTISPESLKLIREEVYGIVEPEPGLSDAAAATLRAKFLGLPDAP